MPSQFYIVRANSNIDEVRNDNTYYKIMLKFEICGLKKISRLYFLKSLEEQNYPQNIGKINPIVISHISDIYDDVGNHYNVNENDEIVLDRNKNIHEHTNRKWTFYIILDYTVSTTMHPNAFNYTHNICIYT